MSVNEYLCLSLLCRNNLDNVSVFLKQKPPFLNHFIWASKDNNLLDRIKEYLKDNAFIIWDLSLPEQEKFINKLNIKTMDKEVLEFKDFLSINNGVKKTVIIIGIEDCSNNHNMMRVLHKIIANRIIDYKYNIDNNVQFILYFKIKESEQKLLSPYLLDIISKSLNLQVDDNINIEKLDYKLQKRNFDNDKIDRIKKVIREHQNENAKQYILGFDSQSIDKAYCSGYDAVFVSLYHWDVLIKLLSLCYIYDCKIETYKLCFYALFGRYYIELFNKIEEIVKNK